VERKVDLLHKVNHKIKENIWLNQVDIIISNKHNNSHNRIKII
jgi:hypothetical protein